MNQTPVVILPGFDGHKTSPPRSSTGDAETPERPRYCNLLEVYVIDAPKDVHRNCRSRSARRYDAEVTLLVRTSGAFLTALWMVGCGVSVAQPIGGGPSAPPDAEAADSQADAADPLYQGLVAYLKLDEQAPGDAVVDSSGTGHGG